jgi:DNA-binding CsgD family transcriptional regulator
MPGSIDQLAPRERQVLALAARGLANKQIARQLDPPMSEETVKGHLKHIFLKLAVPNRTAAVAEYLKHTGGT